MRKIKELFRKMNRNEKFRCGGFSVLLTVIVIFCVLGIGLVADIIENRFSLSIDLSFNRITSQGQVTDAVLAQLQEDVHIYALTDDEDKNSSLLSLLNRYQAAKHVTVSEESLLKNPVLLSRFSDTLSGTDVSSDCLIVHCPATDRARILTEDDYYTYDYDMQTGYFTQGYINYEKCITEAIVYVTQPELPFIQLLTGHGELTAAETSNLESLLNSANYRIERVHLSGGGTLDPDALLMILCPQYDITEQELLDIHQFAQAGGNLFIVSSYDTPIDLPNFNTLLSAYGVQALPGLVIAQEQDKDSYFGDSPVLLMPYMQEVDVTRTLLSAGKNILVLTGARAFSLPDILPEGVSLSPVLVTGQSYIRNYLDGSSTTEQTETDLTGRFPVALWADKMFDHGVQSHAFVMGDENCFLDYYLLSTTDAKPFLLQVVRSLHGQPAINLDILPKEGLRDSLYLGSVTPAVIAIILLPLLVLFGAALVLLPRKNL